MVRLHQLGRAVALICLVSGPFAVPSVAGPGPDLAGGRTAFELLAEVRRSGGAERRVCAGTRVGEAWLLTAGHCLPEPVDELRLTCGGGDLAVRGTVRHPTHDLALIEISPSSATCGGRVSRVSGLDEVAGPLWAPLPVGGGEVGMREVGRGPHVLRLSPEAGCWTAGGSGTPILRGDRLVAVLIAGPPGCGGTQTAVRLDPVLPWLRRHLWPVAPRSTSPE